MFQGTIRTLNTSKININKLRIIQVTIATRTTDTPLAKYELETRIRSKNIMESIYPVGAQILIINTSEFHQNSLNVYLVL